MRSIDQLRQYIRSVDFTLRKDLTCWRKKKIGGVKPATVYYEREPNVKSELQKKLGQLSMEVQGWWMEYFLFTEPVKEMR